MKGLVVINQVKEGGGHGGKAEGQQTEPLEIREGAVWVWNEKGRAQRVKERRQVCALYAHLSYLSTLPHQTCRSTV